MTTEIDDIAATGNSPPDNRPKKTPVWKIIKSFENIHILEDTANGITTIVVEDRKQPHGQQQISNEV